MWRTWLTFRSFSPALLLLLAASVLSAEEQPTTPQARVEISARVAELDEQIAQLDQQAQELAQQITRQRRELTEWQLRLHAQEAIIAEADKEERELRAQIAQQEKTKEQAPAKIQKARETIAAAREKLNPQPAPPTEPEEKQKEEPPTPAEPGTEPEQPQKQPAENKDEQPTPPAKPPQLSEKEIEKLKQQITEAEKEIEETEKALKSAREGLKRDRQELEKLLPEWASRKEQATAAMPPLREEIARLEPQLQTLLSQRDALGEQRLQIRANIQCLLEEAELWVSFRERIAPVFHEHCLPCHNQRSPQGGYNMATFRALMAGGESGQAVTPGDADDSLLYLLTHDGSMPQDAEPLTADQLEWIKQWIERGARIETDIRLDTPLIRIIPAPQHPQPPEVYPTPVAVSAVTGDAAGQLLITSGYHEVLVWSRESGELLRRIPNFAERIHDLQLHPDGRRLAVAGGTPGRWGEVKLFDVQTGELLAEVLGSEDVIFAARFSPDGTRLATAGADRAIHLFDAETLQEQTVFTDHADWVLDLDWSEDGKHLVSASRDKTAKVFDLQSDKLRLTFSGHGETVSRIRMLPGSELAASAGGDRRVRLWNMTTGKEVRQIGGFSEDVTVLLALPEQQLLTLTAEGKLRVHQTNDGKLAKEASLPADWPLAATLLPDSQLLTVGTLEGKLLLWDLKAQSAEQRTPFPGLTE